MLAHTRWACTGRTRSFPLALVLAVTHSTLTLLLLRSDTRLNLGGAIGTFLLYSNSFFVLLHNFYTFCSMFFFLLPFCCCCCRCCAFFCVVFFFIATRDRGSSSSPAMCNCPLPLPSLLQSLSSSPSPSPSMVCVDTNLLLFHSHSHPGQSVSIWRKYLIFSPHFLISFFSLVVLFAVFVFCCFLLLGGFLFELFSIPPFFCFFFFFHVARNFCRCIFIGCIYAAPGLYVCACVCAYVCVRRG